MNNFYQQNGFNQPYFTGNYMQQPNYMQSQMVRPQMTQQPQMYNQQQVQQSTPPTYNLQEVRYGTEDEIRGHIVYVNSKAIFIDRQKGMTYVKYCDNNGESFIKYFKFNETKADGSPLEPIKEEPKMDTANFITRQEIDTYLAEKLNQQQLEMTKMQEKMKNIEQFMGIVGGKNNGKQATNTTAN